MDKADILNFLQGEWFTLDKSIHFEINDEKVFSLNKKSITHFYYELLFEEKLNKWYLNIPELGVHGFIDSDSHNTNLVINDYYKTSFEGILQISHTFEFFKRI